MSRQFAWDFVTPSRLLMLHTAKDPSDPEWDAYLSKIAPLKPSTLGLLVLTAGGAPNVNQRQRLNDWIGKDSYPRAVVLDSLVARGALTALSWFDRAIKAFSPAQVAQAFNHLGISATDQPRFRAAIKRLQADLDETPAWFSQL